MDKKDEKKFRFVTLMLSANQYPPYEDAPKTIFSVKSLGGLILISSDLMSKLLNQSTWDLREGRDQASCAGGALHLRAALSWNWKLLNTLQMESRPSWSEKARSQLNHRNLRNCQHVELIKSLPQNIAYFITNAYLTFICAQELYQYIKSKKVCKRKRVWEESPSKMPPLSMLML